MDPVNDSIADPAPLPAGERRAPRVSGATTEVPLSNGEIATVRQVSGRDMINASMVARTYPVQDELVAMYALAAQVSEIRGEPILLDEMMDMPGRDVDALIEAAQKGPSGKDVPSSAAATSAGSARSPD